MTATTRMHASDARRTDTATSHTDLVPFKIAAKQYRPALVVIYQDMSTGKWRRRKIPIRALLFADPANAKSTDAIVRELVDRHVVLKAIDKAKVTEMIEKIKAGICDEDVVNPEEEFEDDFEEETPSPILSKAEPKDLPPLPDKPAKSSDATRAPSAATSDPEQRSPAFSPHMTPLFNNRQMATIEPPSGISASLKSALGPLPVKNSLDSLLHTKNTAKIPPLASIPQTGNVHEPKPSHVAPAPLDGKLDLNKLGDDELKKVKDEMDKDFQKTFIKPGDPGFVYDIQKTFNVDKQAANDWDEDSSAASAVAAKGAAAAPGNSQRANIGDLESDPEDSDVEEERKGTTTTTAGDEIPFAEANTSITATSAAFWWMSKDAETEILNSSSMKDEPPKPVPNPIRISPTSASTGSTPYQTPLEPVPSSLFDGDDKAWNGGDTGNDGLESGGVGGEQKLGGDVDDHNDDVADDSPPMPRRHRVSVASREQTKLYADSNEDINASYNKPLSFIPTRERVLVSASKESSVNRPAVVLQSNEETNGNGDEFYDYLDDEEDLYPDSESYVNGPGPLTSHVSAPSLLKTQDTTTTTTTTTYKTVADAAKRRSSLDTAVMRKSERILESQKERRHIRQIREEADSAETSEHGPATETSEHSPVSEKSVHDPVTETVANVTDISKSHSDQNEAAVPPAGIPDSKEVEVKPQVVIPPGLGLVMDTIRQARELMQNNPKPTDQSTSNAQQQDSSDISLLQKKILQARTHLRSRSTSVEAGIAVDVTEDPTLSTGSTAVKMENPAATRSRSTSAELLSQGSSRSPSGTEQSEQKSRSLTSSLEGIAVKPSLKTSEPERSRSSSPELVSGAPKADTSTSSSATSGPHSSLPHKPSSHSSSSIQKLVSPSKLANEITFKGEDDDGDDNIEDDIAEDFEMEVNDADSDDFFNQIVPKNTGPTSADVSKASKSEDPKDVDANDIDEHAAGQQNPKSGVPNPLAIPQRLSSLPLPSSSLPPISKLSLGALPPLTSIGSKESLAEKTALPITGMSSLFRVEKKDSIGDKSDDGKDEDFDSSNASMPLSDDEDMSSKEKKILVSNLRPSYLKKDTVPQTDAFEKKEVGEKPKSSNLTASSFPDLLKAVNKATYSSKSAVDDNLLDDHDVDHLLPLSDDEASPAKPSEKIGASNNPIADVPTAVTEAFVASPKAKVEEEHSYSDDFGAGDTEASSHKSFGLPVKKPLFGDMADGADDIIEEEFDFSDDGLSLDIDGGDEVDTATGKGFGFGEDDFF